MTRQAWITLPMAALAGCGMPSTNETAAVTGQVALTNAAPAEVQAQAKAAGGMRFDPGQWETRIQIVDMDMQGLPAGPARDMALKQARGQVQTVTNCVTPEQAANPDAGVIGGGRNGQCRYTRFNMGDGRIDGVMTCQGSQGDNVEITTRGSYDRTSFSLEDSMKMTGQGSMTMRARVTGRRTGPCAA